jgi:hypothetical protein
MARHDPTRTDRVGFAIGLMILTGAVVGQIGGLMMIREGRASMSWPQVEGTITRVWIEKHTSKSNSGSRTTRYHVHATYRYKVGQQTYLRRRHSVEHTRWRSLTSRRRAQRWASKNAPVGRRVRVFHDPANPGQTVIVRGTSFGIHGLVFFSALFLGVGWVFLQHARPAARQQPKRAMYITAALIGSFAAVLNIIALVLM